MRKLPGTLPDSYVIYSSGLPCNADRIHIFDCRRQGSNLHFLYGN